jgi:thioredoxin reductase
VQDRKFGFLAPSAEILEFALFLRGWSGDVTVLTDGRYAVPPDMRMRLESAGLPVEEGRITRLVAREGSLQSVEIENGGDAGDHRSLPLDVLFARPPQRQVAVVQALGLALDAGGYVQVDERRQTSIPGIYAAGDLITAAQSAILAAAAAMQAVAMINHELTLEPVAIGALP